MIPTALNMGAATTLQPNQYLTQKTHMQHWYIQMMTPVPVVLVLTIAHLTTTTDEDSPTLRTIGVMNLRFNATDLSKNVD
jgi:hypothetical protein